MKSRTLASQLQQSAQVNRDIILPEGQRTNRTWPLCLTCFKEVEACELKNVNRTSCEIWAACSHSSEPGAKRFEDYYKVYFPIPMDGDPLEDERNNWALKRAMHDMCPFNPEQYHDDRHK